MTASTLDPNGPQPYSVEIPEAEELIERANVLTEPIARFADYHQEHRTVHPDVIEMIQQAGLFRVLRPKRWGGYEMCPTVAAEVQFALAKADHSVGWVFGVLSVHAFEMALFPDQACADVYGHNDEALICSSFQPGGNAVATEGGFLFNGRWRFASGSNHADWCFLGGHREDGFITCLIPREEYELVDTWFTPGLRGTGSQDMIVANRVIPEHRIHAAIDGFHCDSPGNAVNTGLLYRLPFHQVFIRGITNSSIGALDGMIDAYIDYITQRVTVYGTKAGEDPDVQQALGEAMLTSRQLKAELRANYAELSEYARRGEAPPFDLRLLTKLGAASVADRCREAAQRLFECTGGHGLFERNTPFGRQYIDMISAKQHIAAQNHTTARNTGALALGLDSGEFYL
ncbi:hypothetical protein [Enemella sp. A6]|uniref:hypothetical protein n=1 Tax=Enemella sp. A6 TaxID=3440152 RepID=UPI003EBBB496